MFLPLNFVGASDGSCYKEFSLTREWMIFYYYWLARDTCSVYTVRYKWQIMKAIVI